MGRVQAVLALLLILAPLALFAYLAHGVTSGGELVQLDREISDRLHIYALDHPGVTASFVVLTELGSTRFLVLLAIAVAAFLFSRRQPALAIAWMLVLIGGGLLDWALKHWFQRARPVFTDAILTEPTYSFPSGHSMGSIVSYGMLAYLLLLWLVKPAARLTAIATLPLLILAIGFSRIYLGVHWFSDVAGGFAAGAAWLALGIITVAICGRQRAKGPHEASLPDGHDDFRITPGTSAGGFRGPLLPEYSIEREIAQAIDAAWEKSFSGSGRIVEQGGSLIRTLQGLEVRPAIPGPEGSFGEIGEKNFPPAVAGEVLEGTFHTHPHPAGIEGIAFSAEDIFSLGQGLSGRMSIVGAGKGVYYVLVIEDPGEAAIFTFNIDRVKSSWWNGYREAEAPTIQERSIQAVLGTIAGHGMRLYRGVVKS